MQEHFADLLASLPFANYRCDWCEKLFDVTDNILTCSHCKHVNRPIPIAKDCPFCKAVNGMTLIYQMEGEYGKPYICHYCLKDEHGNLYPEFPTDPMHLASLSIIKPAR